MSSNDYELLSAYIDDALTTAERADLEARLQADPRLQQELASLRQTVMLIRDLPPLKAPRNFTLSPRMIRPPLPFPLTSTFSALSTAAAVLLFVFAGYFLLQANGLRLENTASDLQMAAPAQDQVASVPTVGDRESNQGGGILAPPTELATASPAPTAAQPDTGRTQTNIPATPPPMPTSTIPGALGENEEAEKTVPPGSPQLSQQTESQAGAANTTQTEASGSGGANANVELFAADGAATADDQLGLDDAADRDGEGFATLDETTFEQGGVEAASSFAADATLAAYAPVPQETDPNFRVLPSPRFDVPTTAPDVGQAAAEPSLAVTPVEEPADAVVEEDRTAIIEPSSDVIPASSPPIIRFNSAMIGTVLLLASGVLLIIAILTTVARRRRQTP